MPATAFVSSTYLGFRLSANRKPSLSTTQRVRGHICCSQRPQLAMASLPKPAGEVAIVEFRVQIGCGTDLHGQDATVAAVRACRDAIEFNSLPCLKRLLPGGDLSKMTVFVKLGIPKPFTDSVNEDRIRAQFPYGKVVVEVVEGGLVSGSAIVLSEQGDAEGDDRAIIAVASVSVYC